MERNIRNDKPSLILLVCLVGFPQISETIFTPSLKEIAQSYLVSESISQLTLSIYFLAFAIGVFFWGRLCDKYERKKLIIYGVLVYAFGSLFCYLSENIETLLLARFIQAVGASAGSVIIQAILRDSFEEKERHFLFAKISAILAFTPAIGPLIGGFVGDYYGYKLVFLTLVFMAIFLLVLTILKMPKIEADRNKNIVPLYYVFTRMLKNKKTLTYGFLIGVFNGILFSYYAEAPFIFIKNYDLSMSLFGFLGIIIALATVLGSFMVKKLLKSNTPQQIINMGIFVIMFGSVFYLIAINISLFIVLIAVFLIMFGIGLSLPNSLSMALVDFKDCSGTAGAILSLSYYIIVSIMTSLMSYFHSESIATIGIYFFIISFISLFFSKRYLK